MSTVHRKRARSVSSSESGGGLSDVELGSTGSPSSPAPAAKYHRAPSPEREHLCTLPPFCSQPDTAQRFATLEELEAHQTNFHQWVCRVAIRDKPGRVGEGAELPIPVMPEHFAGRNPGGRGKGTRWRECGKVFPDGRLLELVSLCLNRYESGADGPARDGDTRPTCSRTDRARGEDCELEGVCL